MIQFLRLRSFFRRSGLFIKRVHNSFNLLSFPSITLLHCLLFSIQREYNRKQHWNTQRRIMDLTDLIFRSQGSRNYSRNMPLLHSSSFKFSVLDYGVWMSIGITQFSRSLCSSSSRVQLFGRYQPHQKGC